MTTDPKENRSQSLNETLQMRRTTKAMSDEAWACHPASQEIPAQILSAAGEAPFHKAAAKEHRAAPLDGVQPWRCYHLDATQCRTLRQRLIENGDQTKIPKMLAVADFLIQVTWLPNPNPKKSDDLFEPSIQNMEHIAAASAAIQNMLLAATARDIPNYWSSGGALRSPETFALLGIPENQILLGSIFLFPTDLSAATTSPGALRSVRSPTAQWARKATI